MSFHHDVFECSWIIVAVSAGVMCQVVFGGFVEVFIIIFSGVIFWGDESSPLSPHYFSFPECFGSFWGQVSIIHQLHVWLQLLFCWVFPKKYGKWKQNGNLLQVSFLLTFHVRNSLNINFLYFVLFLSQLTFVSRYSSFLSLIPFNLNLSPPSLHPTLPFIADVEGWGSGT